MNFRHLIAAALLFVVPAIGMAFTPESGWYLQLTSDNDAGKGGTGIGIEIQNQFLFAAGFIYGQNGLPIWVAMQGPLTKQADGSWALEDDNGLYSAENGQCLGMLSQCPYKAPTKVNIGGFKISFVADNIGKITWGIPGNQSNAVLERFTYNLGSEVQSLIGRWDVVTAHEEGDGADGVHYGGDRLRITSTTANADGTFTIVGCVENYRKSNAQTCDGSSSVYAILGIATPAGFGYKYTLYTLTSSSPKIVRVYSFSSNGLGGQFSGTIKGRVNFCGVNGVTSPSSCTEAQNVSFTGYKSASGQYALTGSGMDQNPTN
jgi:hypothetical protein